MHYLSTAQNSSKKSCMCSLHWTDIYTLYSMQQPQKPCECKQNYVTKKKNCHWTWISVLFNHSIYFGQPAESRDRQTCIQSNISASLSARFAHAALPSALSFLLPLRTVRPQLAVTDSLWGLTFRSCNWHAVMEDARLILATQGTSTCTNIDTLAFLLLVSIETAVAPARNRICILWLSSTASTGCAHKTSK